MKLIKPSSAPRKAKHLIEMFCIKVELITGPVMFLPPWPSSGAAAAPAEAADHGSSQMQALLGDAVTHSTPSRGSPCSDSAWPGTFPFPLVHTQAGKIS